MYLKRNMAGGEKKRVSEIEWERASRAVGEMIREFQIFSPNEHLDIETSTEGISTTVPTEETESGLRDESSESRIESVEFLDDEGSPISAGTFKNFVNLGSDGKFIDKKEIKGYYQLAGNARVKVKFSDKGEQPFSLRLECVGGKLEYSEDEKKANIRYKVWSGVQQFMTDSSGMAVVDLKKEIDGFSLGQGGGQKFKVVVSDDEGGERRTGGILETWRRLYVVEVKMRGLDSTAGTIDILKDEFSSHCIDILNLGEEEVAHRSNMSTNEDFDKFTEEAMKVCSKYKEYDSHLVRIGYTDHLADKMELLVDDDDEPINTNQKDVEITVKDTNNTTYSLWKGINDEDWFVSCTFIDARTKKRYDIPKEACTPLANDGMNYETVKVEISRLFQEIGSVSGELDLKVNVVKGMSGGISFGNKGIIAVCTRAWWKKKSPEGMGQTLVHEIGHQVGMVPGERASSGLAQGKHHYLGLGHVGNHCHNGCDLEDDIDKDNNKWNGNAREKSTCVMFGSANGKESFCSECAMQVRKVDLSEGVY